jgi:hypothetical protein
MLALDRYFQVYESQTPDFVTRIWLQDKFAGEAEFRGRSVDKQQINVPISYILEGPGISIELLYHLSYFYCR